MVNNQPTISVLMPVYDVPDKFLRAAIESVLGQTLNDFEFLIVDDGSKTEGCLNILAEYARKDNRIRIIRNENNLGLTKALNIGLAEACGEYVARLDGNDLAHPDRLQKQIGFMEKNPDCVLVGTWAEIVDAEGKNIGKQKSPIGYAEIKRSIIARNPFAHSSWFFRKDIIEKMGGYDETMVKAQDYDLLLKLVPKYKIAAVPEFLCSYRFLDDGLSFQKNKLQEKYAILARKKALQKYGYPKKYYFQLIIPEILHLFVPSSVKKMLIKSLWKI